MTSLRTALKSDEGLVKFCLDTLHEMMRAWYAEERPWYSNDYEPSFIDLGGEG